MIAHEKIGKYLVEIDTRTTRDCGSPPTETIHTTAAVTTSKNRYSCSWGGWVPSHAEVLNAFHEDVRFGHMKRNWTKE